MFLLFACNFNSYLIIFLADYDFYIILTVACLLIHFLMNNIYTQVFSKEFASYLFYSNSFLFSSSFKFSSCIVFFCFSSTEVSLSMTFDSPDPLRQIIEICFSLFLCTPALSSCPLCTLSSCPFLSWLCRRSSVWLARCRRAAT